MDNVVLCINCGRVFEMDGAFEDCPHCHEINCRTIVLKEDIDGYMEV